jgi:hypothetical protein
VGAQTSPEGCLNLGDTGPWQGLGPVVVAAAPVVAGLIGRAGRRCWVMVAAESVAECNGDGAVCASHLAGRAPN